MTARSMDGSMQRTLFLCGDVMTGRGIDQILPHPSAPHLFEPYVKSAREYVELAERANGPIPRRADYAYVWGDALAELRGRRPDARIVNLETSVTTSEDAARKTINYRMHPANVPVLSAAAIDCCTLANNHVLDWGVAGLLETLTVLADAHIPTAGAGSDAVAARAPAALPLGGGARALVFAFGTNDCGIPPEWAAAPDRPGVHLLEDFSDDSLSEIVSLVAAAKLPNDVAVASVHWGSNWGYEIPRAHRQFAHALVDRAGVDVVYGHSSHHPKAIEIYRERPIMYGCGDFLSDYEGIGGYSDFRGELTLMYFVTMDVATGELVALAMAPLRLRRFRLERPSAGDRMWLRTRLEEQYARFGHRLIERDDAFALEWR